MKFNINSFLLSLAFGVSSITTTYSQTNNAAIAGDFADPSIIKAHGKYYAIGTSSEWAPHFPVYTSANLKDWKQTGYIFDKTPEWTSGSFWAPEYYYMNNTYYVYYTARRKKDGVSYIGVATSKFPDRGFTDHGVIIDHGKEAIDAFIYNDNGQLYITFKAYGLENRPIELLGYKLSADGLKVEGETFSLLKDDERIGMEGQSIMKKDGYYYLFYSAGGCCGGGCSYDVRVARATNFKGPYEKYDKNPLLQGGGEWKCTGHGTFVSAPDNKTVYLHHAYRTNNDVFTGREGMLAELTWPVKAGWPQLNAMPVAATGKQNIVNNFKSNKADVYWQWDFRNSTPVVKQANGKLSLTGTVKETNKTGIVLTVRPTSDNFDMAATVSNSNAALKGISFYGDAHAAVGVGVAGTNVQFWMVKDNVRSIIAAADIDTGKPVQLKFSMRPDRICRVYYKQGFETWKELQAKQPVDIGFLPQWDRSPRAGLHFMGDQSLNAQFSAFSITNL